MRPYPAAIAFFACATALGATAALLDAQPAPPSPPPPAGEPTALPAETEDAAVADFLGRWSGTLQVYNPGRGPAEFPMALEIEPTAAPGTHVWRIIYGEGDRMDVRDYRLVTRDAEAGLYAIDEQNSIIIPSYFAGDAFHSSFALDTTTITLSYTRVGDDAIRFLLTSWDTAAPETSGGEGPVPTITSVRMTASQNAMLTREDPEAEPAGE